MKELIVYTNSKEETIELGKKLGKLAKENMTFLLMGDLGAGKTTLTQGIAQGLEIKKNVTSPTFNIQKIYQGRLTLNHIDAYRLEGLHQDLGFEEFLYDGGLTVIEWSQFIPELIPDEYLMITIHYVEEDKREFIFQANGKEYEELLEELS